MTTLYLDKEKKNKTRFLNKANSLISCKFDYYWYFDKLEAVGKVAKRGSLILCVCVPGVSEATGARQRDVYIRTGLSSFLKID